MNFKNIEFRYKDLQFLREDDKEAIHPSLRSTDENVVYYDFIIDGQIRAHSIVTINDNQAEIRDTVISTEFSVLAHDMLEYILYDLRNRGVQILEYFDGNDILCKRKPNGPWFIPYAPTPRNLLVTLCELNSMNTPPKWKCWFKRKF
jgi:hypothetical protein